jgi:hypothetical protein
MHNYIPNKKATISRQKRRPREEPRVALKRNSCRVLVGAPRPTRRWEGIFKIDLKEIGCKGVDWIDLAQDRDSCWDL